MCRWGRSPLVVAMLAGMPASMLTACAREEQQQPNASHYIVSDVIVSVTNQTSREKRIFLEVGKVEYSLGSVDGRSSRSFSMPSSGGDSTSELQLEARDRRSLSGIRSGGFRVSSGQRVVWTLDQSGRGIVMTR